MGPAHQPLGKKLALSKREFVCERCGVVVDRDLNAAKNLRNLAVGSTVIARGDGSSTDGITPSATTVCEARIKHQMSLSHLGKS